MAGKALGASDGLQDSFSFHQPSPMRTKWSSGVVRGALPAADGDDGAPATLGRPLASAGASSMSPLLSPAKAAPMWWSTDKAARRQEDSQRRVVYRKLARAAGVRSQSAQPPWRPWSAGAPPDEPMAVPARARELSPSAARNREVRVGVCGAVAGAGGSGGHGRVRGGWGCRPGSVGGLVVALS